MTLNLQQWPCGTTHAILKIIIVETTVMPK
jgi:hypothetical protein